MTNERVGNYQATSVDRLRRLSLALRPGVILGIAVAGVVGLAGIVQWNQRLMLLGVIAAFVIIALNFVVVAVSYWHGRNTDPGATYLGAEDVVRLRGPKAR